MALINKNPYSPLPLPKPNGGLTTGKEASGPWGAIPTVPEAGWLTRNNLQSSAGVPIAALFQLQAGVRPGNNSGVQIPEVQHYAGEPGKHWGPFDIYCVPEVCDGNTVMSLNGDCRVRRDKSDDFLYNTREDSFQKYTRINENVPVKYLTIM